MAIDIHKERGAIIQVFFVIATIALLAQLLNLQILNTTFKAKAEAAGSSNQLQYPARGILFDRNGVLLVVNKPIYDLFYVYNQFEAKAPHFDTLKFCHLLGVSKDYFIAALDKNWKSTRYSKAKAELFLSRISAEKYATFQESLYQFPGFHLKERNARAYPHKNAAHVLGYIGEIGPRQLADSSGIYGPGDYLGTTGLEKQYEYYLRGQKGKKRVKKDIYGSIIGELTGDENNVSAEAGFDIFTTLDLDLQSYGEELMRNKVGGIVAIEPATGEILSMISTPNYDPGLLEIGVERGKHYAELQNDSLLPFFNRSLQAKYPPGSLFKPLVALIGMQVGTLQPERGISCQGAYFFKGTRLTGCHNHVYCSNVSAGIQHSCNAYFVTIFREIVDHFKDESTPRKGLDEFNSYLKGFGMGSKLGLDFPGEQGGNVPSSSYYDQVYKKDGRWHSLWIRSLAIGQGELLATTLQMANMAAAIGNKGYFYTPHLMKSMRDHKDNSMASALGAKKHLTGIDYRHFQPVVDGMELVVLAGTARSAAIPGVSVCGKTGTAENNQGNGADHSIFFAFAPKDNPKIAIAVYIENGGFGGTYAAPIASLMIEKYLKNEISSNRKWLEDRMLNADLIER